MTMFFLAVIALLFTDDGGTRERMEGPSAAVEIEQGHERDQSVETREPGLFQRASSSEVAAHEGGFWLSLREVCRFPVEGTGLVWFAGAVTLLAVFPFGRPLRMQSFDVLVLLAIFPLSVLVEGHEFEVFLALLVLTGYLSIRCIWRSFLGDVGVEPPNLRTPALIGMLMLTGAAHVQAVFTRGPDESGIWTVFGGQYLWRHGRLPYGQIGAGPTHGPVLYALAAPVAHFLPPTAPTDEPNKRTIVDSYNIERLAYGNSDFLSAKILALAFDIVIAAGLIIIGRQAASWRVGLSRALVYAVNGVTVQDGLLRLSHLAPMPLLPRWLDLELQVVRHCLRGVRPTPAYFCYDGLNMFSLEEPHHQASRAPC